MQKTYTCKYCGKPWTTNHGRNGHQTWCDKNPTLQQTKLKLSNKLTGKICGIRPQKKSI